MNPIVKDAFIIEFEDGINAIDGLRPASIEYRISNGFLNIKINHRNFGRICFETNTMFDYVSSRVENLDMEKLLNSYKKKYGNG